jgi:hypothetical protein
VLEADLLRLRENPDEETSRWSGDGVLDGAQDRAVEAGLSQLDRESHEGDQALHKDEGRGEREGPRVAESVGGAKADESITHQLEPTRGCERPPGVVAL